MSPYSKILYLSIFGGALLFGAVTRAQLKAPPAPKNTVTQKKAAASNQKGVSESRNYGLHHPTLLAVKARPVYAQAQSTPRKTHRDQNFSAALAASCQKGVSTCETAQKLVGHMHGALRR